MSHATLEEKVEHGGHGDAHPGHSHHEAQEPAHATGHASHEASDHHSGTDHAEPVHEDHATQSGHDHSTHNPDHGHSALEQALQQAAAHHAQAATHHEPPASIHHAAQTHTPHPSSHSPIYPVLPAAYLHGPSLVERLYNMPGKLLEVPAKIGQHAGNYFKSVGNTLAACTDCISSFGDKPDLRDKWNNSLGSNNVDYLQKRIADPNQNTLITYAGIATGTAVFAGTLFYGVVAGIGGFMLGGWILAAIGFYLGQKAYHLLNKADDHPGQAAPHPAHH